MVSADDQYNLVFRVQAFSGIKLLEYYNSGDLSSPYPATITFADKVFRHPDMFRLLSESSRVRFTMFDLYITEPLVYIEFFCVGDPYDWFSQYTVYHSSLWVRIDQLSDTNPGAQFKIMGTYKHEDTLMDDSYSDRLFYINRQWQGHEQNCNKDEGWFMAKSPYQGRDKMVCEIFENYWNYPEALQYGHMASKYQPPAFLYSDKSDAVKYFSRDPTDLEGHLAGQITLEVLPIGREDEQARDNHA